MKCATTLARIGAGLAAVFGCIAALEAAGETACQYPYAVRLSRGNPCRAAGCRSVSDAGRARAVRVQRRLFRRGRPGCGARLRPAAAGGLLAWTRRLRHAVAVLHRGTGAPRLRGRGPRPPRRDFCTIDRERRPAHLVPQSSLLDPKRWTTCGIRDRKDDLEALIDALLVDPILAAQSIAARSARPDIRSAATRCSAWAAGWPGWRDGRIGAVLALSPYVQPFTAHGTLAALRVPVM